MHLLRKNYILAGVLSIAIAGFIGSSGASALDGISLPGLENWQAPRKSRNIPQVNYNIIDGAGDGAIAIKKVDEQGNPLANAKFKIDGVAALYVNGKYIYSTELGLYSEFTTDKDGLAIVSGLPFGTYKVTETASPEGYELNPQTYEVTVSEDNMVEVEYGRKKYYTTFSGWSADFSNYIATTPDNQLFFIGGESDFEHLGQGSYLEYDPGSGTYTSENSGIELVKNDSNHYAVVRGEDDLIPISKTDYDERLFYSVPRMSEVGSGFVDDAYIKENGDGTITIRFEGDEESVCAIDEAVSCPIPNSSDMFIRKGNGGYYLTFEDGTFVGVVFEYDAELDKYIINPPLYAFFVSEIDEDTIYFFFGAAVSFSSVVDRYMLPPTGAPLPFDALEDITGTVSAVNLTVTNDSLSPEEDSGEDAINPQTSDAIMKVALLGVIGALPILIARKELKKR